MSVQKNTVTGIFANMQKDLDDEVKTKENVKAKPEGTAPKAEQPKQPAPIPAAKTPTVSETVSARSAKKAEENEGLLRPIRQTIYISAEEQKSLKLLAITSDKGNNVSEILRTGMDIMLGLTDSNFDKLKTEIETSGRTIADIINDLIDRAL